MAQTDQKPAKRDPSDAKWDLKQGKPKDLGTAQTMEKAQGRYSASEQGEDCQKRKPVKPPRSHTEDGYAHEPKQR